MSLLNTSQLQVLEELIGVIEAKISLIIVDTDSGDHDLETHIIELQELLFGSGKQNTLMSTLLELRSYTISKYSGTNRDIILETEVKLANSIVKISGELNSVIQDIKLKKLGLKSPYTNENLSRLIVSLNTFQSELHNRAINLESKIHPKYSFDQIELIEVVQIIKDLCRDNKGYCTVQAKLHRSPSDFFLFNRLGNSKISKPKKKFCTYSMPELAFGYDDTSNYGEIIICLKTVIRDATNRPARVQLNILLEKEVIVPLINYLEKNLNLILAFSLQFFTATDYITKVLHQAAIHETKGAINKGLIRKYYDDIKNQKTRTPFYFQTRFSGNGVISKMENGSISRHDIFFPDQIGPLRDQKTEMQKACSNNKEFLLKLVS